MPDDNATIFPEAPQSPARSKRNVPAVIPSPGTPQAERKVHPAAAIYPMLDDDEMSALADDIRENGLRDAILTTLDGTLIDGRNRLAACAIAEVTPRFEVVSLPDDPQEREAAIVALVVSKNTARRHMSKGQLAMALAMHYPEVKRGRGQKDEARKAPGSGGISQQRLNMARAVLRWSTGAAQAVMAGTTSLDAAYEEHRQIEKDKEDETEAQVAARIALEKRRAEIAGALIVALNAHQDLAKRHGRGLLTDDEVVEEAQERARIAKEKAAEEQRRKEAAQRSAMSNIQQVAIFLAAPGGNFHMVAEHYHRDWNADMLDKSEPVTPASLRRNAQTLSCLADLLEGKDQTNG